MHESTSHKIKEKLAEAGFTARANGEGNNLSLTADGSEGRTTVLIRGFTADDPPTDTKGRSGGTDTLVIEQQSESDDAPPVYLVGAYAVVNHILLHFTPRDDD